MVKGDIVGSVWFGGEVGIILSVSDYAKTGETGFKLRAHIGKLSGHKSFNEAQDSVMIRDTGSKFPVEEAISLIRRHGDYTIPISLLKDMEYSW